jgi:hypothetical protein
MTETQLQYKLGNYFTTWFDVEYEVWSTDRTKRIDIVMVHKSDFDCKYPFGIEVKVNDKKKGKSLGGWLKQAHGYTQKDFINYGKLIVLCFPRISEYYLREGKNVYQHDITHEGHNVNTFLGSFQIGEIIPDKKDDKRIVFSGSVLWHQKNDQLRTHNIDRVWKGK